MASSTQSNVIYSNELFKQYLMKLSSSIVWKNNNEALKNETTDLVELYLTELFITANRGLLNFDIVKSFPRSVLLNAGISSKDLEMCAADKTKIPQNLRKAVVAEYSEALTSINPSTGYPAYFNDNTGEYETIYNESNNYYRKLMGLPNKEDTDFVYNTDSRWSTKIPIHELPLVDRYEMEDAGILTALQNKYPSKEYIEYLGRKSIDPFKARVADRFELLYYDKVDSEPLNRDFSETYSNARQLALNVYYNKSLNNSNSLYENFLAMCIVFMTIQTMQHKYLKVDITRDFYDIESLKLIYDSYGVPFYNEIPLEYHRKIVKNINKLISYKGSSQVFFDLFDIFDIGSIDIFSYYLTKTHIMDSNGKPSFILKQKKDEFGKLVYDENENPVYEYDDEGNPILDESNYEIKFSRAKIYDDPALSISDNTNSTEYEFLTDKDPYWIDDPELIKKLTGENFNYLESKYIGIQTVFDLMKLTYENAYVFRMIMDNEEFTDKLTFRWADLGIECSLFDIFVYLSAIYCRERGYAGVIRHPEEDSIQGIPAIMDTLGYDFKKSIEIVKTSLVNNSHIKNSTKIMLLINNIAIDSGDNIENINESYGSIVELRDTLIDGYMNAISIEEYHAYRQLYQALMVSREIDKVYSGPEGVYETFTDLLAATSPELMQRYMLLDDSELLPELTLIVGQLETLLDNLKYTSMIVGAGSNYLIDSLFKILTFFKSAKAELVGYNILYTMTMRGTNFFKLLDTLNNITENGTLYEENTFIDLIKVVLSTLKHKNEILSISDKFKNDNNIVYLHEYLNSLDTILRSSYEIIEDIFKDKTWYIDFLTAAFDQTRLSSEMLLQDTSDTPLVHLEILESKYSGMIKDNINMLTDTLRDNPESIKLQIILDAYNSIDFLRSSTTVDIKSMLSSISELYDTLSNSSYIGGKVFSKFNISDSIDEISSNTIKDKINPIEDFLNSFKTNQLLDTDTQTTIDIPAVLHETNNELEGFCFSDILYEYDSSGKLIPIK